MTDLSQIRMIFCDIDLTLLPYAGKDLTPTAALIEKLIDRGIAFVPCSGRTMQKIPPEILGVPNLHYVVGSNGSCVYDMQEKKRIASWMVPVELAIRCTEIAREESLCFGAYVDGERVLDNRFPTPDCSLSPITKSWHDTAKVVDLASFLSEENQPEYVMAFSYDDAKKEKFGSRLREAGLLEPLSCTSAGFETYEIVTKDSGKAKAMAWLSAKCGIALQNVLAAGDNYNDLEMLQAAGLSVAPANAVDAVLQAVDVVVPPCEQDGVEQFLRQLL